MAQPEADGPSSVFPVDGSKSYGVMEIVAGGSPMVDHGPEDSVFSWPHLLIRELALFLAVLAVIWLVALLVPAPLEEMANPTITPNPAKAPWYFVGLQELLVYFDPWIAGVVLPSIILVGLAAIPYVDTNPAGEGEYTFRKRRFAVSIFSVGMLMWFGLIIIGEVFRGPSWAWYWPWESWEVHKETVSLGRNLPLWGGVLLLVGYFGLGMVVPAIRFKEFYESLGRVRYCITMFFVLCIFGVVGKVLLRLLLDVKYVLHTDWFSI